MGGGEQPAGCDWKTGWHWTFSSQSHCTTWLNMFHIFCHFVWSGGNKPYLEEELKKITITDWFTANLSLTATEVGTEYKYLVCCILGDFSCTFVHKYLRFYFASRKTCLLLLCLKVVIDTNSVKSNSPIIYYSSWHLKWSCCVVHQEFVNLFHLLLTGLEPSKAAVSQIIQLWKMSSILLNSNMSSFSDLISSS